MRFRNRAHAGRLLAERLHGDYAGSVLNEAVVSELAISEDAIARAAAVETAELERRERAYRGDRCRSRRRAGRWFSSTTAWRPVRR